MAQTFAYDLTGFLRVLYRRRAMIFWGTLAVTILTAIASLLWPQTWRADARVLVSTPKYKESLKLIPKPFDVLTYQSVMGSDRIYQQIIVTLKWYREAVHSLYVNRTYQQHIRDFLQEKGQTMSVFELIQNTNLPTLTEYLIAPEDKENPLWINRIQMLGNLSAEELELIYQKSPSELDDLSVFDLRKMLSTSVSKVRETNLEVEYSRVIRVSAEYDTAAAAKMMANTWLDLFLVRAEELVRGSVERQINLTRQQASALESDLNAAQMKLAQLENESDLERLRAEAASKLVQLTGLSPNRRLADQVEEAFNLEDEDQPFMKERRQQTDSLSFQVTPQFPEALLPTRQKIQGQVFALNALLAAKGTSDPGEAAQNLREEISKQDAQLSALDMQIKNIVTEITGLLQTVRTQQTRIDQQRRGINQIKSSLTGLQPLLDEAALLESRGEDVQYADVSVDRAIKPDKRAFPKRSLMTAVGMVLSFFLWCCMAFFLDIWQEVIKPEDTPFISTGQET